MTEQTTRTTQRALELRKRLKRKKPNFVRPESWRYVRLKKNWRRPRGLDHKVRLQYDGWPPGVSVGYRGPKAARGLHPSGYKEVLVYNVEDLGRVDPEVHVARIAHTVGKRKRIRILAEAKKKKITILNIKIAKEAVAEEKELTEEEKVEEKEIEKEIGEAEKPKEKPRRSKKRKAEAGEQ